MENRFIVSKFGVLLNFMYDDFRLISGQAQSEDIKKSSSESQYRPVELSNIPLPTTGGQVTGNVNVQKLFD